MKLELCLQQTWAISDGARDGGKPVCLLLFLDQKLAALLNILQLLNGPFGILVMSLLWFKSLLESKGLDRSCWKKDEVGALDGVLRKLVLNVQVHNERAVHLYKSWVLRSKVCQARGACSSGEFLDVTLWETDRLERFLYG